MRIFEGFQKGVNLGGWISQFDVYDKKHFDTFITEADIQKIASWGFDHVRVPVDYILLEEEDGTAREDGFAYLVKTDVLRGMMFFSYEKGSMTDLYALTAAEVQEVIKMNRNGLKPVSLKNDSEISAPDFISAVGDDSITRFDKPKGKGGKRRGRGRQKGRGEGQKPKKEGGDA